MKITWNPEKRLELLRERDIDLEDIETIILSKEYIDIAENPARKGQYIFILLYKSYIHAVPFIIDQGKGIFIKTAYPSRKFHKKYGGQNEK